MRRLKNVTISLEEDVARWVRIRAADENSSVSRLVGDLVRRLMRQADRFQGARREFERLDTAVISSSPYPRREDLHDRPGVR